LYIRGLWFYVFSPKLVLLQNTDMKILKSSHISPFGGLNFVLEEFERQKIGELLQKHLPVLPIQCKYSWKDILYSFWSIYFCGGDCIEDLGENFRNHLKENPFLNVPSPRSRQFVTGGGMVRNLHYRSSHKSHIINF
jgi:hypothetical protein